MASQNHAWVTCNGTDPLLCAEDNCANMVEPPNELEVSRALTRKFNHLLCVMKAIRKFKAILDRTRSETAARSSSGSPTTPQGVFNSKDIAKAEVITALLSQRRKVRALNLIGNGNDDSKGSGSGIGEQETRFLGIGTGARDDFAMDEATPDIVSDSPTAVDFNVYDRAYESAVEQINSAQNTSQKPTVFLTKFVKDAGGLQGGVQSAVQASDLPAQAAAQQEHEASSSTTETLAQLASSLDVSDTK